MISKKLLISAIAVPLFFIFTLLIILEQQEIAESERLEQQKFTESEREFTLGSLAGDGPPVFLHTVEIPSPEQIEEEKRQHIENTQKEIDQ